MLGFEPLDKLTDGVRLRFWWIKSTKLPRQQPMRLFARPDDFLVTTDGIVAAFDLRTCRPLVTGDIVDICSNDAKRVPNWDILQFQWTL